MAPLPRLGPGVRAPKNRRWDDHVVLFCHSTIGDHHRYEQHYGFKYVCRASERNFTRRNKADLGPREQAETSLKIVDLRSNKTISKLS